MGTIKILPTHVANKIAAGEVVERPASLLKELIENALDAKSTQIDILVKNGGVSLIRVADNGMGMDKEDATLCLERHATSKISSIGDLFSLSSFGFRGEALPSIAAVSQFTLTTRMQGQDIGTQIKIDGGTIQSVTEAGCAQGTIIQVEDLFFNMPARRKFLKKELTELGYIEEVFIKLAFASPEVGFSLTYDENKLFSFGPAQNLLERIGQIKGTPFAQGLVEISAEINDKMRFHGYVGMPSLVRANRNEQHLFVNNRAVKNASLGYALTEAFYGLIPSDKFPVGIIFFTIDPRQVDINIHPTKREVKIANEKTLKVRLMNTIKDTLARSDIFKRISFSNDVSQLVQEINQMTQGAKERFMVKDNAWAVKESFPGTGLNSYGPAGVSPSEFSHTSVQEVLFPNDPSCLAQARVIGQAQESFLIAQTHEDLLVIDQHAAHERILYEKILAGFEEKEHAGLQSIIPVVIELSHAQTALLEEYRFLFTALGFGIQPFGNNTYTIDTIPSYLEASDIAGLVKDTIDQLEEEKTHAHGEEKKKHIAASLACKKRAVKAHTALSLDQIQNLIKELSATQSPFSCPHGRPTLVKLSFKNIGKQFGR